MRCVILILSAFAVAGLSALAVPGGDKKEAVREIKVSPLELNFSTPVTKPSVLKSVEDLEKRVPNKEARASLKEQVNFDKEQVVLFRWNGSGQDKLKYEVQRNDGKILVVLTYTPGLTRDLRQHALAVAMPQDAAWKFAEKRE